MRNTALFALSSPEGSQNYFSKLLTLKVNGVPFFRICDCFMICEDCRKLETDKQLLCNHVKQVAHWLSEKKGERIKALFKADPAAGIRELAGIISDDYIPCFLKENIDVMFALPPVVPRFTPEHIFVSVDPSGGGTSELAICSGYFDGVDHVVGPIMYSIFVASTKFVTISMALSLLYPNRVVFSTNSCILPKKLLKCVLSFFSKIPVPS